MLGTPELKKFWLETVRDAIANRGGAPARVHDVRYQAMSLGFSLSHRQVYARLERLTKWGYLEKQATTGYSNVYKLTGRTRDRFDINIAHGGVPNA
jgi:Fe2+ or Zn2+ uptake regulation protein